MTKNAVRYSIPSKKRINELPKRLFGCLLFAVMLLFLLQPKVYIGSFLNGLNIFGMSVLPSLLPFMLMMAVSVSLGWGETCSKVLAKPCKMLFRSSGYGGFVLIMSVLSGYPVGAKLIGELFALGRIDQSEAKRLASYTSTTGPVFVLGTLGAVILKDTVIAVIVLLCHYASAIITGLIFCNGAFFVMKRRVPQLPIASVGMMTLSSGKKDAYAIMLDNVLSVLVVGGFVAFFNMLGDMLGNLGLFRGLASLFPALDMGVVEGVAFSFIEVTRSCMLLNACGISRQCLTALVAFSVTVGGASVLMQSMSFLSSCKIKWGYFIAVKLTQGIIAALLSYVIAICVF